MDRISGADAQAADYEQLFQQRGHAYDVAMRHYPHARDEEFSEAVRRAQLQPGMQVADVPAGGGYLQSYLPAQCRWLGHEPCANFSRAGDAGVTPLLPLPWGNAAVDAVLSIAGVHHLEDKRPLFAELLRVVRPGGRLVLADVWRDSAVATFLDGFVGDHNSTGHTGSYLDEATADELRAAGWQEPVLEHVPIHWRFAGHAELAAFCTALFDLRGVTPPQVLDAVLAGPGIDILADGVGLRWGLTYCMARRPS